MPPDGVGLPRGYAGQLGRRTALTASLNGDGLPTPSLVEARLGGDAGLHGAALGLRDPLDGRPGADW